MFIGLLCALGAAICFGTASVMQAVAARRASHGHDDSGGGGVDPRLLMRALRQWWYVGGLGIDAIGFCLELVALRLVPIYVVGAALAASLAVTAVVASWLLKARLGRPEWGAVLVVCVGLGLLAAASGAEGHSGGSPALRWGTLIAAVLVLAGGTVAGKMPERARAAALGLGSGLGFGVVTVAVRLIPDFAIVGMLTNPATYAVLVGGAAAFALLTTAFQRGSVTAATAGMVIGETFGPALVGVLALGDRTRSGFAGVAVAGYLLAVLGALALARFGEGGAETGPEGAPESAGHTEGPGAESTPGRVG